MEIVEKWLDPYRSYLDPATLAAALTEAHLQEPDSSDPNAFFETLVAPIDGYGFTTKALSHLFTDPSSPEGVETTPAAVVEFYLPHLHTLGEIPPDKVASLAEAYFKLGQVGNSEVCTAVAFLAGDRSATVLFMLAGMAVREDRLAEGRSVMEKAETLFPDLAETAFYGALLRIAAGDEADGLAFLEDLVTRHPAYRPGWTLLIDRLLAAGCAPDAVIRAEVAVRNHPLSPAMWGRLARARREAGRFEEALEAARHALRVTDESVGVSEEILHKLQLEAAAAEESAGLVDEALRRYQTLLRGGCCEPALFSNAASCLKRANRTTDAVEILRTGLDLHPQHPALLTNMGEISFETHNDEEAFDCLQKAAELEPQRTGNIFLMAIICLRNRRFEAAVELAGAVARVDPARAPQALLVVGDAYRFLTAPRAALEAYREAQRMAPDNVDIQARLGEFEGTVEAS